jgi:hypothetical protein
MVIEADRLPAFAFALEPLALLKEPSGVDAAPFDVVCGRCVSGFRLGSRTTRAIRDEQGRSDDRRDRVLRAVRVAYAARSGGGASGGIGTLSQALAAGVPQVAMPMVFDQEDNANRLEANGVGRRLDRDRFTGAALAAALETLLADPDVEARCRAVAERLRADNSFDDAPAIIERLM